MDPVSLLYFCKQTNLAPLSSTAAAANNSDDFFSNRSTLLQEPEALLLVMFSVSGTYFECRKSTKQCSIVYDFVISDFGLLCSFLLMISLSAQLFNFHYRKLGKHVKYRPYAGAPFPLMSLRPTCVISKSLIFFS